MGSPGGSDSKESTCSAGDLGFIPGLGRFPSEGNGNRLQYFCLENSMDREARWATVHGITKESDTTNTHMIFPVVMYSSHVYVNWAIKKLNTEELMLSNCGDGEDS